MTDNPDKSDLQNSGIPYESETAIQKPILIEDKTPLSLDAHTVELIDEPTHKFTVQHNQAETNHKTKFESEPANALQEESQDYDLAEDLSDENALRPSRTRFVLVCILFINMFIFAGINTFQAFSIQSFPPYADTLQGDNSVIVNVTKGFEDVFQVGDILVSIDGIEVNPANIKQLDKLKLNEAGVRRTVIIRRNGQVREVETVYVSPPLSFRLNRVLYEFLLRVTFLTTGLLIFLFKPNDKQAFLLTLIFLSALASTSLSVLLELPPILLVVKSIGLLIIMLCAPLFLHFCLVFPEHSSLLRRFPKAEWLIYLPILLITIPSRLLLILQFAGYSVLTSFSEIILLQSIGRFIYDLHFLAGILILIFTYRRSGEIARRKLRVSVAGLLCSFLPFLLNGLVINPLLLAFEIQNPWQEWMPSIVAAPLLLTPLVSAYAIVRDRVIPISFVIRRGLQYLLAKNVLRLFLILPILGIIWNIFANTNRTLNEILFQNSLAFYFFIAFAVGVGLLMRSHLSIWIDRRFFREQYNQEQVLRELTEAVKKSDSLPKLSRLVCSKIQAALHPSSVYLFFQDDSNSEFSVGYMISKTRANLKLSVDSPLLHFMQRESGAIEFPTSLTDDLSNSEKRWLRETGANLLVPIHSSDSKLIGLFSLGEKMSQIPYTQRDKELLETLAHQIALVHENIRLKDRMRNEQKIKAEVLSRLDEGNINLLKECPRCGKCFDRTAEECDEDYVELTFSLPVERTIENRYRLEQLLGKGGMGAVYAATDTRINRRVAVKILSGAMFGNRDALRRFEREAQTAGKLNHRNIVTVFDYGVLSTEGAFLVMELVRGETLSEVLNRKEKLDASTVIAWFSQVLDGVEAAHKAGIIHRDLKPDNIFVTRNEDKTVRLCILDFGLARFNEMELTDNVTMPGTVMGTLGYMPPEQLRGERTDERSDLFAVGVIIYEALNGEKPFTGKTYQEIVQSMSTDVVFDESESFGKFFERSLAQRPENRFATAGEMKNSLLGINYPDKDSPDLIKQLNSL